MGIRSESEPLGTVELLYIASANKALREARRTPRFGHIWQVVAGANSGERGGLHAFYRPTESAIGVFRPPAAQLSIKSTFTKD